MALCMLALPGRLSHAGPPPASATDEGPDQHSDTYRRPSDPAAPTGAEGEEAAEADTAQQEPEQKKAQLPSPLDIRAAMYPPEALSAGLEAEVLLELTLTAEGEVIDALVVEPIGNGFDEAVLRAVEWWQFTPATNEAGETVPSRIQYRYRFTLEAVPVVSLEGRVRTAGTREALADAEIVLQSPDGTALPLRADAAGLFQAVDLAPGRWTALSNAPGHDPVELEFEVQEGKVAEVTLYLEMNRPWEADRADAEILVEGDRIAPEITERDLNASDIRYLPGSGGDIVRAVQNMPGVARTSFNAGQIQVRGTTSDSTGFFLGGAPLPIVFHFGGLSTVINSDSLDEVAFMPGGYGVRFGRRIAGVVDLRTSKTLPERSSGYASVDLFQSTAFIEQKVGEDVSLTFSGRRSYIDAILQPVLDAQTDADVRLPRYWDIQARMLWVQDNGSSLDALLFASDDRFTLSEPDPDADGGSADSVLVSRFSKLWLQYRWEMGGGWLSEHTLSGGPERMEVAFRDEEEAWEAPTRFAWRSELYRGVPEDGHIGWRLGVDVHVVHESFDFEVEGFSGLLSYTGDESGDATAYLPAVYLEQTQREGPVEVTPGVRVDWLIADDGTELQTIDPRIRGKWEITPATHLLVAGGKYSQFPQAREYVDRDNDLTPLVPEWSAQLDVGARQEISPDFNVEAHVYHWWLHDLVSGHEDRFEFVLGPPPVPPLDTGEYENDGVGRVIGAELLARYETDRTFAWLSATLSHSTRIDRPGESEQLFDQDQPLVISALASRQLPRRWRLGVRWRYASGKPYVPVANRVLDLTEHTYFPVYDESAQSRLSSYQAFDVRVDKDFIFEKWMLTTYLDLMNATNRKNLEMVTPSVDYSEELPVYGLPIIPALGVKGEW
jgi:TonB family protein